MSAPAAAQATTWTIEILGRPALLNGERSKHWRAHREATKAVRALAKIEALRLRLPRPVPGPVVVTSWPTYLDRRSWPDVAAWVPTTKAVVDGLVDAGVLPKDDHRHVVRNVFEPPLVGDHEALVVQLRLASAEGEDDAPANATLFSDTLQVALALAEADPTTHVRCVLCDADAPGDAETLAPSQHAPSCPWRLAVAVERNLAAS